MLAPPGSEGESTGMGWVNQKVKGGKRGGNSNFSVGDQQKGCGAEKAD